MREEIAYQEMKAEMEREQQGQQSPDPTMKDQEAAASAPGGTVDPTQKREPANLDPGTRQADQRDARRASGPDRMPTEGE